MKLKQQNFNISRLVTNSLVGTSVGSGIINTNSLINKDLNGAELLAVCKPYLDMISTFEWVHVCVTVVPILIMIYTVVLSIYIAYVTYSFATQILKFKEQNISQEQIKLLQDTFSYGLTLSTLQRIIRFFKVLFFLQIINQLNWTKSMQIFGGFFVSTPTISFIVCLLLILVWLGFKIMLDIVARLKLTTPDLPLVLLFLVFFLCVIIYSNNAISFYIGVEGTALATCVALVLPYKQELSLGLTQMHIKMKTVWGEDSMKMKYTRLINYLTQIKQLNQEAVAAGLLYFLLNCFVTISLSYLLFFLIMHFNVLSFFSLFSLFITMSDANFEVGLILIFFLIVFSFKLGITPFHFWLPGVFTGANYSVLYFLTIPIKVVFSFLLFKVFYGFFQNFIYLWSPMFLFLGVLSICIGSIGLLTQNQIKKFFAYSTLNHFGNIFLAFGMGNFIGQNAFLIYFFSYILMNIFFIHYISCLTNGTTNQAIYSFNEINNVNFTSTYSQIGFTFTLLSMMGLPPFVGFWGKMVVLKSFLLSYTMLGYFLVVILIITSVVAAYSYLGVIKTLFITSFKNHQLSQIAPFSIFAIKNLVITTFFICFGFLIQFSPMAVENFNFFIASLLFSDLIY